MPQHTPRKRFGQNFLHDKNIIQQIVNVISPDPGENIVEIGPGQGALTVPILKLINKLNVIEIDRDLIPALIERCADKGELITHEKDALEFDFNEIINIKKPIRVIGNLPYNISTPLIFHLLKFSENISDMHFMLQKEVVDRLAAKPSTSDYGRLSVMVQYHCDVESLFDVPPAAFYPPPKVTSSIVKLIPHKEVKYKVANYQNFEKLVKAAFSMRRKTLRNSLKSFIKDEDWQKIQVDPKLRPEELSVEDYTRISDYIN